MRNRCEVVQQSYRFVLSPNPDQVQFLERLTGATRFFFNWGLALVKQRLNERAAGKNASVPWTLTALCSEFARVKDDVAPWRRDVVCGSQQAGFERLGDALQSFLRGRQAGRQVRFPRFRVRGKCAESVIFQRPRIRDARHVEFDRRMGPIRSKESLCKLIRLLDQDPRSCIRRATVSRRGRTWFVSFTVERGSKSRKARRPNVAVGIDLGLVNLATLSTGETVAAAFPLEAALRRLRRLQRQLERQRRAVNPGNYLPDGPARMGANAWRESARMRRTLGQIRRLHERIANLRREQAHQLTTTLTREYGVIGAETLAVRNLMANRRLSRRIADVGWATILEQLAYKSSWAGSTLVAADRFYASSKTCSACRTVRPKLSLGERVFVCNACGFRADRDRNAAVNLALMARSHAEAEGVTPCYVAAAEAETQNARREQVSPEAMPGHSSLKREASGSDAPRRREAPAVA